MSRLQEKNRRELKALKKEARRMWKAGTGALDISQKIARTRTTIYRWIEEWLAEEEQAK